MTCLFVRTDSNKTETYNVYNVLTLQGEREDHVQNIRRQLQYHTYTGIYIYISVKIPSNLRSGESEA